LATRPIVPQEHHVRPIREGEQGGVRQSGHLRQGQHGRRPVPSQGRPQDVPQLPGALPSTGEDVQLLHHW